MKENLIKKEKSFLNGYTHFLASLICFLAALFYSYEYLLRILPGVMMPELMKSFSISAAACGNLVACYYYAYTPMQLPVGLLMDRYGPRYSLFYACLLCAAGTLLFSKTDQLLLAAAGRFLVGFGSAFAFVGVLRLGATWLPANRFGMVAGLTTSLGVVGGILGQFYLSSFVSETGWKDIMLYSGLMGFFLAPLLFLIVRDKPHSLEELQEKKTISLCKLLQDCLSLFSSKQVLLSGLIGGLMYVPTTVFEAWYVRYTVVVHSLEQNTAIKAVSMVGLGWAAGAPIMGWISDKIQRRRLPMIWGSFLAGVLLICLLYVQLPLGVMYIFAICFGIMSSTQVLCFALGRENCNPRLSATALAMVNFLVMLGGTFCQPMVGVILDYFWDGTMQGDIPLYGPIEFHYALSFLPIGLFLAGFLGVFFLKETYARSQTEENTHHG